MQKLIVIASIGMCMCLNAQSKRVEVIHKLKNC